LYFKKDDKSTSDNLRLNSATVLDDTTDSGKPLKQLTHLLKKSFAKLLSIYDKTAYQKQLLGPKITGVWARGVSKQVGSPTYFCNSTVEASNFKFVHNLGLGSVLK